jgi:cytochrome c oxidase subunit 3
MESATLTAPGGAHEHEEHHHGPPEPNRSSRVEPQFLGMLLFIISEIMLFLAFFTAYFFIRVVLEAPWPAPGDTLPIETGIANSFILFSSSGTMHWALESARRGNRRGLQLGLLSTFLLGLTFLGVQINEYVFLSFSPADNAQGTIFYGLTGLHGAHVAVGLMLLAFATVRAFRGHYSPEEHRGVEVPGIYWHFVDVMWIFVFGSLYLLSSQGLL